MAGHTSGREICSHLCHCVTWIELDHVPMPQLPHLQSNKADEELGNPLMENKK